MKIAVTGAGGRLGRAVAERAAERGIACRAFTHAEIDAANAAAVAAALIGQDFGCIVNCAAYTDVDGAEREPEAARAANALAPAVLARTGIGLLHVSTDFVFDGRSCRPYAEDDRPNPIGAYGRTKLEGERVLLGGCFLGAIVRTSWLYAKDESDPGFYGKILRRAKKASSVRVVSDQTGSPTLASDLAAFLVALAERGIHRHTMSVYHFANAGSCSRAEFARAIIGAAGLPCSVEPVRTVTAAGTAARPAFSVLSCEKIRDSFGVVPRDWKTALLSSTSWEI